MDVAKDHAPTIDDEPEGGDPPCWAHLFDVPDEEDAAAGTGVVDLVAVARAADIDGAVWTHQSDDLNANLLFFAAGHGVEPHVNGEVDVLLVGISGEGEVEIDGAVFAVRPGHALIIAKGARRSMRARGEGFAYVTCHRRRGGLWPAPRQDPAP